MINFGLIYGASAHGLAKSRTSRRAAAANHIETLLHPLPGRRCLHGPNARASAKGEGRLCQDGLRPPPLPAELRAQQTGRRQGQNGPPSTRRCGAPPPDLIKLAMIAVSDWLESSALKSRLIRCRCNDELVLEVPDDEVATIREHLPRLIGRGGGAVVAALAEVGEATTGTRRTGAAAGGGSRLLRCQLVLPSASAGQRGSP